jgi:hypothetical protein
MRAQPLSLASVAGGRGLNVGASGSIEAAGDALVAGGINLLSLSRIARFHSIAELAGKTGTGFIQADGPGRSTTEAKRNNSHGECKGSGHVVRQFVSPIVSRPVSPLNPKN